MNGAILRVFGVVVLLFGLLVAFTSRWTVFESSSLNNNPLNSRPLIESLKVQRGRILADDGSVLAYSKPAKAGTWTRVYPTSSEFSQPVGYYTGEQGNIAGLERSRNPALSGAPTGVSSVFGPLSSQTVGNDVYTTLDPKAQRVAIQQLAGRAGSVVALDPRTGAVLVMYANPTYDNNHPNAYPPGTSAFNNSTQAGWPPGSTFKVVTAVAAIDSGKYKPTSTVNGNSPKVISGVPLQNDGNESFGDIDLTKALTYSVNTVWAQVAESLGTATMTEYMQRFGFYAKPPLDYPPIQLNVSQPWTSTIPPRPIPPGSPNEDIGRIGIGEGGLLVTPLQMAMVASAVADGGTLMEPRLTNKIVNPEGQTVTTISPHVQSHVMSQATSRQVTQMMEKVVEEGTGQAAQLNGVAVAGKTGTAQIGSNGSGLTQPWFIGFAPIQDPKVAVAVTVARTQGGYGGTVAAPIAAAVIQTLLAEGR